MAALVPKDTAFSLSVDSVLERAKEGGALVRFSYDVPRAPFTPPLEGEELKVEEERVLEVLERETKDALKSGSLGGGGWAGWLTGTWEGRVFLVKVSDVERSAWMEADLGLGAYRVNLGLRLARLIVELGLRGRG